MKTAFTLYHPTRVPQAKGGGFKEVLGEGVVMWGEFAKHKAEIVVGGIPIAEDTRVGDIIEVVGEPV